MIKQLRKILLTSSTVMLLLLNFGIKVEQTEAKFNEKIINNIDYNEYKQKQKEQAKREETAARNKSITYAFIFFILFTLFAVCVVYANMKNNAKLTKRNMDDTKYLKLAQELDTDFNEIVFKNMVKHTFKELLKAVLKKDVSLIPNNLSEELYDKEHSRIVSLIGMNGRLSLTDLEIGPPYIIDVKSDDEEDVITTLIDLRAKIYVRNMDTYKLISGNEAMKQTQTYLSKFKKKSIDIDKKNDSCPSCCAPLALAVNGKCAYCHSKVQRRKTDWQLDEYVKCDVNKAKMQL